MQSQPRLHVRDPMQMVMLGTLSLDGEASVFAMRKKLLAVAQRLGISSIKSVQLVAAASDHAKHATKSGTAEVQISLNSADATPALCVDVLTINSTSVRVGFDHVEALIERQTRGWRGFCEVDLNAIADAEISGCQAVMAEQSVDELVEALHANNQALRAAKDAEETARTRLSLLLGAVPVVVYSFRARGDFAPTFVSDSIQGILGYQPEEYLQHADFWRSRVHPDDLARVESEQAQLFEKGQLSAVYRFRK